MNSDGVQKGNREAARQNQDSRLPLYLRIAVVFLIVASIGWTFLGSLIWWGTVVETINWDCIWSWQDVGIYFLTIAAWFGVLVIFSYVAVLLVKLLREY